MSSLRCGCQNIEPVNKLFSWHRYLKFSLKFANYGRQLWQLATKRTLLYHILYLTIFYLHIFYSKQFLRGICQSAFSKLFTRCSVTYDVVQCLLIHGHGCNNVGRKSERQQRTELCMLGDVLETREGRRSEEGDCEQAGDKWNNLPRLSRTCRAARQSHDASRILMTSFRRSLLPAATPRYDETTTDESSPSRPVILQASSLPVAPSRGRRSPNERTHSDDDVCAI